MTAVFDAPVPAVCGKDATRVGLFRRSAGDAIGDFTGVFTGFFIYGLSFDDKGLSDVRKVQIGVEFGRSPDFAGFDSAVIRRVVLDEIGIPPVIKIERYVLKKPGLVVLDGKVVISFAVSDQIFGDLALGQQGIRCNFFALNIDGIKQRDGGFDLVGALDPFIVYGQGTHFFWV